MNTTTIQRVRNNSALGQKIEDLLNSITEEEKEYLKT